MSNDNHFEREPDGDPDYCENCVMTSAGLVLCGKHRQEHRARKAQIVGEIPDTDPNESEALTEAQKKLQERLDAIEAMAAKELKLLEGVEGDLAVLRRHFVQANMQVRMGLEWWTFEHPLKSPDARADVLFSVAGELIMTAMVGMKHRTQYERGEAVISGFDKIIQRLVRSKLIPTMEQAKAMKAASSILNHNGAPFRRH